MLLENYVIWNINTIKYIRLLNVFLLKKDWNKLIYKYKEIFFIFNKI